eukprot:scaffold28956_cov69-Phaeocystis_antarctica.AAC.1
MPYARRHSNDREDGGHTRQVRNVYRLGFCWRLKQHACAAKGRERTEYIVKGDVEDVRRHHAKASFWVEPMVRASSVLACRARGVHDVRQVVRPHALRRHAQAQAHSRRRHCRLRHAPRVVQLEHRAAEPPRVLRRVRRLRHQPAARRVFHHEPPPLEWPLRVERQVRTAREQHAIHAHNLLERAVQLQRHHAVGRHAARHQPRRHPRRARVQLGVAHRVPAPLERHRVRRARRLRRHQIVHAQLGQEGRRRVVEAAQHKRRLRCRQQRQRPCVSVVRRARQRLRQHRQPRRQSLYALAREEVAVVLDRALDAARCPDGRRQHQLHLGHAAATVACTGLAAIAPASGLHLNPGPEATSALHAAAPASVLLPLEHCLEDGVARRVVYSPRQLLVYELLEGQRRVRHAAHRRHTRRAQQRAHRAVARCRDA